MVNTSGLVIYAKDYKKLVQFYANVLNLKILEQTDDYGLVCSDNFELAIIKIPPSTAKTITISSPPQKRENTAIKPVFFVDNFESTRHLIQEYKGGMECPESVWIFNNYKVCDGFDPEGNIFQLRTSSI